MNTTTAPEAGTTPPAVLDRDAARRLTARIRDALAVADGLLVQAWAGRAWEALGHDSWEAYCAAELPQLRMIRLGRDARDAQIATLGAAGFTTGAIVAAYGYGRGTVHRALAAAPAPAVKTGTDGRTRATRAPRPAVAPQPAVSRADQIVAAIVAAGPAGLTCTDLENRLSVHHGIASGALSRVTRQGRVVHAGRSRNGYGVYVASPDMSR